MITKLLDRIKGLFKEEELHEFLKDDHRPIQLKGRPRKDA